MPKNQFFSPGDEFSGLESLFSSSNFTRDATGPGDDGLILATGKSKWAYSVDASVENRHFNLQWCTLSQALEKCLLSNLSDINAMGAECKQVLFTMGYRSEWRERERWTALRKKLSAVQKNYGIQIGGGDLVRVSGDGFFHFTVMGPVATRVLLRSNARPGQTIFISGEPGLSAAGLKVLEKGKQKNAPHLVALANDHLHPTPPLKLGPALSRLKQNIAAIDTSDGLSSELWHLERQSRCRLVIEKEKLPVSPKLIPVTKWVDPLECVLHGGEDYQLLFTTELSRKQAKALGEICPIHAIGRVEEGRGVYLENAQGTKILKPGGWSH